jgi:hypothetical protein
MKKGWLLLVRAEIVQRLDCEGAQPSAGRKPNCDAALAASSRRLGGGSREAVGSTARTHACHAKAHSEPRLHRVGCCGGGCRRCFCGRSMDAGGRDVRW